MSQGPFLFGTSGASTTNFTNDTDFSYLGGQAYTSNPDWTQVVIGYIPGTPMPGPSQTLGPFASNWIISGTGGTGKILSITFSTGPGGGHHVIVVLQSGGGAFQNGINYTIYPPVPCFKEDTKILTDKGYIPIQNLRKGDLVKTLKDGYKAIDMIRFRKIEHILSSKRIKDQLYKCSKINFPEIFEDLIITGSHCILVDSFKDNLEREQTIQINGKIYVTDSKYRLPACVSDKTSIYEIPGMYTVYHIALENENIYMNYGIYANGLVVETCSKRYLKELSNMTHIE